MPTFDPAAFPAIDWSRREIDDFTSALQAVYVRQAGAAVPRYLIPLLDLLDRIADDAEETLAETPSPSLSADLAGWRLRSSAYRSRLEAASPDDGRAIAVDVIGPLLLGWYPDRPAQTVLDAASPLIVAHAAQVNAATLGESWARLGDDLTAAARAAGQAASDTSEATGEAVNASARTLAALAKTAKWITDPAHPWRWAIPVVGTLAVAGGAVAIARKVLPCSR